VRNLLCTKLKRPKRIFGAEYLKTLGHVVGGGCLRPDPDNVAAILNLPTPGMCPQPGLCWVRLGTIVSMLKILQYY
jgi:hypothetical protein